MRFFLGLLLLAFSGLAASQSLPAFYGAEGGGALSVGGRGGVICEVTSLANSGTGTLRACVEMSGPRTVVFRVGGTIELTSHLVILNPYITIAGQTAPGGGIHLSGKNNGCNHTFRVNTHDVIVRYLTVRKGVCNPPEPGRGSAVAIEYTTNSSARTPERIILDHLTMMWGSDEALSIYGSGDRDTPKNITVQRGILAETLAPHNTGSPIAANRPGPAEEMTNIDVHNNLWANISHRIPLIRSKSVRFINNIAFNWYFYATQIGPGSHVDVIGNLYKHPTPDKTPSGRRSEIQVFLYNADTCNSSTYMQTSPSVYAASNIGLWNTDPNDNWAMVKRITCENGTIIETLGSQYRRSSPLASSGIPITVRPANQIENHILPLVGNSQRLDCMGNWVFRRDSHDARIVNWAQTNHDPGYTAGFSTWGIASEAEVGGFPTIAGGTPCQDTDRDGMPDAWETANGLNPNNDADRNTLHSSGYTMLEMYLNGPMGEEPPPPPPDEALPRIVRSATGLVNNGTGFNITFPSAPADGNKLIFIGSIATLGDANRNATISGFTPEDRRVNGNSSMVILTKTAGGSEGTTYAVTVSGTAEYHSGIMLEIEGADNSNPFNALALTNSLTTLSRTPTVVGVRPITALATDNAPSNDPPSGWGNLVTVRPTYHGLYKASRSVGTDTTTAYSATWGFGVAPVSAIMLINPDPGEPPPPLKTIVLPSGLRYVR
jgi:pectate lyase